MKIQSFLLSASRCMALAGALFGLSLQVTAAPLFTLKGTTDQTRLESQAEVRMSLLGWSDSEQNAAIVAALQEWQQDQDHAKFDKFLQQQESKGYLFTQAATGYSIKYAWSENGGTGSRTVLLVSPALKTRNPYMWKQQNSDPAPFSLVELHWQGEEAVLKTSLDGGIEASDGGLLQLRDYDGAATFARMRDDTPYYLKQGS